MAQIARKHPGNAPGPWFVDTSCINCDASRQCAPAIFEELGGQAVVARQPCTPEEICAATRAMLLCPTASIGVLGGKPDVRGVFPLDLGEDVYLCGYNSPKSFGANSYYARRPEGNLMVDAPRWVPSLVHAFEGLGGISDILLTHRDDVADADRYAAHFHARVWIHETDKEAAPYATDHVAGSEPRTIRPDLVAIPAPGHTLGSVVYLLDGHILFTGDSLYWSRTLDDLCAFQRQCWYSWEELARSLARLAEVPFTWILPGHGGRGHIPAGETKTRVLRLVERMRRRDPALMPEGEGNGVAVW